MTFLVIEDTRHWLGLSNPFLKNIKVKGVNTQTSINPIKISMRTRTRLQKKKTILNML